nr:MAG TPA: hypothetical protein [Siphoviridae sp. ctgbm9]
MKSASLLLIIFNLLIVNNVLLNVFITFAT